jgi:hypothetical protein
VAAYDCSEMLDEVDVLHVERNTLNGSDLLSYIYIGLFIHFWSELVPFLIQIRTSLQLTFESTSYHYQIRPEFNKHNMEKDM